MSETMLETIAWIAYAVLCAWVGWRLRLENRALRRTREGLLTALEALRRLPPADPDVIDLDAYRAGRRAS